MGFLALYARVLRMLAPEKGLAWALVVAAVLLAALVFIEPLIFGQLIDLLGRTDDPRSAWDRVLPWVGLWAAVGIFGIVANILTALHADRLAHRRRLAAMAQFFAHVLSLPPAFHRKVHSARLMRVMLQGTDHLASLWLSFFREQLSTFVALGVLLPMSLVKNPYLGGFLLVLIVLFGGVTFYVIRKTHAGQALVEEQRSELAARAGDAVANLSLVQSFTRITAEAASIRELSSRLIAVQEPILGWWALITVLTRAASTICVISIFLLGTVLYSRGQTTVGEIVAYMGFAQLLIGRLEQAVGFLNRIFFQRAGLAEFFEVMDTRTSVPEKPGALSLGRVRGAVRFEDVSLSYDGKRPAVHDLDLDIQPGTTVALVGPTGAGKSTAMALLGRTRDPDTGRVLIDGHDVRDVTLDSLRRNVGVVFQDNPMFARSIEENLKVGKPDATLAEMEEACRRAQALDFIQALPDGFSTVLGERGSSLSGGERQRLAIARALLKDPPILILDEATSALDSVTESKVQEALVELMRDRTTMVIAHRLSTIRHADLILVFEQGRIVERGSWEELVGRGGVFAGLVRSQGIAPSGTATVVP